MITYSKGMKFSLSKYTKTAYIADDFCELITQGLSAFFVHM